MGPGGQGEGAVGVEERVGDRGADGAAPPVVVAGRGEEVEAEKLGGIEVNDLVRGEVVQAEEVVWDGGRRGRGRGSGQSNGEGGGVCWG